MTLLKGLFSLFRIIETVFRMVRERELRQRGYKAARAEIEKRRANQKAEIEKAIKGIDGKKPPDSVNDLWDGL